MCSRGLCLCSAHPTLSLIAFDAYSVAPCVFMSPSASSYEFWSSVLPITNSGPASFTGHVSQLFTCMIKSTFQPRNLRKHLAMDSFFMQVFSREKSIQVLWAESRYLRGRKSSSSQKGLLDVDSWSAPSHLPPPVSTPRPNKSGCSLAWPELLDCDLDLNRFISSPL